MDRQQKPSTRTLQARAEVRANLKSERESLARLPEPSAPPAKAGRASNPEKYATIEAVEAAALEWARELMKGQMPCTTRELEAVANTEGSVRSRTKEHYDAARACLEKACRDRPRRSTKHEREVRLAMQRALVELKNVACKLPPSPAPARSIEARRRIVRQFHIRVEQKVGRDRDVDELVALTILAGCKINTGTLERDIRDSRLTLCQYLNRERDAVKKALSRH